jgi:2-polyprenyl-3-methyl-5-hydroxy-6-metoxy-1,4-benzoquinol methylase
MNTEAQPCPVCGESSRLLKQEQHESRRYRVYACPLCESVFCPDHHAQTSPDYVSRTDRDLTEEVLWLQGRHKRDAYDQLFKLLRLRKAAVEAVLDVGCGTGGFLRYAREMGVRRLYGYDASEAQARLTSPEFPMVRSATSLSEYIQLLGHRPSVDLITLWDVLEHLRRPDEMLSELHEVCGSDTLVFFSTPNAVAERIKYHLRRISSLPHCFIPWEHVLYYSPTALEFVLDSHDFDVVGSGGTVCYKRRLTAFDVLRRLAFKATLHTKFAPQLFAVSKRRPQASDSRVCHV